MKKQILKKTLPVLCAVMLMTLLMAIGTVSAFADEAHAHDNITYDTEWAGDMGDPGTINRTSCNIVLTADATVQSIYLVHSEVNLCLNGYTLTVTEDITIDYTSTMNICDCSEGETGTIISGDSETIWLLNNSVLNFYGGTVKNTATGMAHAIRVSSSTANIYGGTVSAVGERTVEAYGDSTVNVTGGKLENIGTETLVYVIDIDYNSALNISGGTVTGNNSYCVISNSGTTTISGGTIENLNSENTDNSTITCASGSSLTISGGTVSGGAGSVIDLYSGSTVTITDGTFTGDGSYILSNSGNLTILGGTFTGSPEYTFYNYSSSTTSISGGNFSGARYYTINQRGGTTDISGGTISCGGTEIYIYSQGSIYLSGSPSIESIYIAVNDGAKIYGHASWDETAKYQGQPIYLSTSTAGYAIGNIMVYEYTDANLFILQSSKYFLEADGTNLVTKSTHKHYWTFMYSNNATHHWYNCEEPNCYITDNSQKEGYGEHVLLPATCCTKVSCDVCSWIDSAGAFDINNHESTETQISPGAGTHVEFYLCCGYEVATGVCTYDTDGICTVCGGADISEEIVLAEAELTAAINAKIEVLNARTDLDDNTKETIVDSYNRLLTESIQRLYFAANAEQLDIIKLQMLAIIDVHTVIIDFQIEVMSNQDQLTVADRGFVSELLYRSDRFQQYILTANDQAEIEYFKTHIYEMLAYGKDCIDLLVYVNTLPNISNAGDGMDVLKLGILGTSGEMYEYLMMNLEIIFEGIEMDEMDLAHTMAYGFNEVWKKAFAVVDADLSQETFETMAFTIYDIYRDALNLLDTTLADVESYIEASKKRVEYATVNITSSNISLGESICVNFYMPKQDGIVPQLFISNNGYQKLVSGVEDGDMLKFVFDGVAPQWISETFYVAIIIDGNEIGGFEYSVMDYLWELMNMSPEELNMSEAKYYSMLDLIEDLLVYCSAAQKYTGYENSLSGATGGSDFEPIDSTDAGVDNGTHVTFTGATVFFDSVNTLKFKFTATDLEGIVFTVKVNGGEETEISYVDNGDGTYTITTAAIYAYCFDDVYTITAYKDSTADSKITYSIKSYVYAKQDGTGNIAELAKAIYNYGISAKAYKDAQ